MAHADGLGSVRALTDAAGTPAVTDTYAYDEFGVAGTHAGTDAQVFGDAGEQQDAETGFQYLRARMYNPAIGRLIQRDVMPGRYVRPCTFNRFTYAWNNPISRMDPSGRDPVEGDCGVSDIVVTSPREDIARCTMSLVSNGSPIIAVHWTIEWQNHSIGIP